MHGNATKVSKSKSNLALDFAKETKAASIDMRATNVLYSRKTNCMGGSREIHLVFTFKKNVALCF